MARKETEQKPEKTGRDERLAAALRANLARRKAQMRGRGEQTKHPSDTDKRE